MGIQPANNFVIEVQKDRCRIGEFEFSLEEMPHLTINEAIFSFNLEQFQYLEEMSHLTINEEVMIPVIKL